MKRISSLFLAFALILGLCACAKSASGWQEQYDLGVRYLSEGNYEEAIIAFTAAIEIDPKRPAAYISLADTYTQLGDTDAAIETLNRALSVIGETEEITAALAALGVRTGSPGEHLNAYGSTEFQYREDYQEISAFDAAALNWLETVAAAVTAGDSAALLAMSTDYSGPTRTIWNGYKVEMGGGDHSVDADGADIDTIYIQLRPENGMGYYCHVYRSAEEPGGESWMSYSNHVTIISCPCVDWQWNGAATATEYLEYLWQSADGQSNHATESTVATGTLVNSLWDGSLTITTHRIDDWDPWGLSEDTTVTNRLFQNGVLLEQDGEPWNAEADLYWDINMYGGGGTYRDEWMLEDLFW